MRTTPAPAKTRSCHHHCGLVLLLMLVMASAAAPRSQAAPQAAGAAADTLAVPRIGATQAMLAATRGDIVLVDVRGEAQRAALGHIRGDVHIPIERLASQMAGLPKGKRWVFYCSCHAEEAALDAARQVLKRGPAQVAALVGGYDAWKAAGGPVESGTPWETLFRVDTPPGGWGKMPVDSTRCRYARDDSVAASGNSSARCACVPAADARGFAGFTQRLDAAPLRGRSIMLSAMVRAENVERVAFLWMAAEDAQGRMIPLTPPDADPVSGTMAWRQVQVTGVVPPVAVRLLVGLSLTSPGRVWLDDVRVVAGEEPGLPRVRVVVENHGFED